MQSKRISELEEGKAINDGDYIPIVQDGVTKRLMFQLFKKLVMNITFAVDKFGHLIETTAEGQRIDLGRIKGEDGERGAAGEKGATGPQGERGEKGEKGDKGDQGEQGIQGERGEKGERGADGPTGYSEPVGSVMGYPGKTEPDGWLFIRGQTLSRTDYSRLLNWAIENDLMGTMFGEGDGETTFTLPDWREVVFVGAGQNGLLPIAAHDVYDVGQFKDDQLQRIRGQIGISGAFLENAQTDEDNKALYASGSGRREGNDGNSGGYWLHIDSSRTTRSGYNSSGTLVGADVTHGKQVGLNYIIKY